MSSDYSPNPDSISSVACARAASSSGPSHTNSISEPHLMQAPMMFNKLLALIFLSSNTIVTSDSNLVTALKLLLVSCVIPVRFQ